MANKRKKNKRVKTRARKGKKSNFNVGPGVTFGRNMPPAIACKLRWAGNLYLTASSVPTILPGYGNSAFEPFTVINTNSVFNHEWFSKMWSMFRVKRSTLMIRVSLQSTSATPTAVGMGGEIVIFPSKDNVTGYGVVDAIQQPFAKYKQFTTNPSTVRQTMSSKYMLGFDGDEKDMAAATAAVPALPWFWNIIVLTDGDYTDVNIVLDMQLDVEVQYFQARYDGAHSFVKTTMEDAKRALEKREVKSSSREVKAEIKAPSVCALELKTSKEAPMKGFKASNAGKPVLAPGAWTGITCNACKEKVLLREFGKTRSGKVKLLPYCKCSSTFASSSDVLGEMGFYDYLDGLSNPGPFICKSSKESKQWCSEPAAWRGTYDYSDLSKDILAGRVHFGDNSASAAYGDPEGVEYYDTHDPRAEQYVLIRDTLGKVVQGSH